IKFDVNKQGKELTINVFSSLTNLKVNNPPAAVTSQVAAKVEKKEKSPDSPQSTNTVIEKKNGNYNGKKVSLDFQDADVVNVLRLLAEVSKLNMIIGDNVKGKITIKMLEVPWDQALNIILKMKGLGKIYENNVVRIDTLANIAQQQEEEARAKEAMIKAEDLSTKIIPVNYAKAKEIADSIKKSLSTRGDITIDERTNTLIIKDIPDKHMEIENLLKTLDKPTPQVLIEARIVQADTNFARDLGIQWGGDYTSTPGDYNIKLIKGPEGTATTPSTNFAVNLPASGVAGTKGSMGFTIGKTVGDAFNLDLRLSAGETKGLTKILSAPKIATLDNKEAIIQQGESIPYKTFSQEGTKTEFIDAALTLKVTPKVTPDGHILMNIKITKNRQGSIVVEGTPSINKKEATTQVLVKDGETTVIGGIYELSDTDNMSMVPWLHQVPLLGWLFKNTSKSNIKSELLIFITPKIIPVTS
ncbi:MAG: type IV pilus secretin PilQ, partial [Nitrospirota bacterium]